MKLKLYKNGELSFSLKGYLDKSMIIFDNISYNKDNCIFIKEENDYKLIIDFNKSEGKVEFKDMNYNVLLKMNIVSKNITSKSHRIEYYIESEEDILNELEIIF